LSDSPTPAVEVCSRRVQVAVGVIRDAQQRIFITQRRHHTELAGYWEFPGGKLESGETLLMALVRELYEEVGIRVEQAKLLQTGVGVQSQQHLYLHYFLVEHWHGEPYGREGQPHRWIAQQDLRAVAFPPTNTSVVSWLLEGSD
jgi:8-oxo-dGTP diphosphatase